MQSVPCPDNTHWENQLNSTGKIREEEKKLRGKETNKNKNKPKKKEGRRGRGKGRGEGKEEE